MEIIKMKWIGERPLLLHNGQLANPLNKWARELKKYTAIRKKTDEHYAEMMRLEWFGGLYMDEAASAVVIPEDVVLGVIVSGAKRHKNGEKAKAGVLGVAGTKAYFPLQHDGPKDIESLFNDARFRDQRLAVVGTGRVLRTRPRFDNWHVTVALQFDPDIIDRREVLAAAEACGSLCGVGDFTPRFGRFRVEAA